MDTAGCPEACGWKRLRTSTLFLPRGDGCSSLSILPMVFPPPEIGAEDARLFSLLDKREGTRLARQTFSLHTFFSREKKPQSNDTEERSGKRGQIKRKIRANRIPKVKGMYGLDSCVTGCYKICRLTISRRNIQACLKPCLSSNFF